MTTLTKTDTGVEVASLDFSGQFNESPDGKWTICWGVIFNDPNFKYGEAVLDKHWILGYENSVIFHGTSRREILGAIINDQGFWGIIVRHGVKNSSLCMYDSNRNAIGRVKLGNWLFWKMAITRDGTKVAALELNSISAWDIKNCKMKWYLDTDEIGRFKGIRFSEDETKVLVLDADDEWQSFDFDGADYTAKRPRGLTENQKIARREKFHRKLEERILEETYAKITPAEQGIIPEN